MTTLQVRRGTRVRVARDDQGIALNALGTVSRITTGGERAWVELDERSKVEKVHPFGADDSRGRNVRAYVSDLALPEEGTRRARARAAERAPTRPGPERWGRDHWSTFAYVETRVVDHEGVLNLEHMRVDVYRHPLLANTASSSDFGGGSRRYPTRLKGGELLDNHDDHDCAEDMTRDWPEMPALLANVGTEVHPRFALTDEGRRVAALLRAHKAAGGSFATFSPASS